MATTPEQAPAHVRDRSEAAPRLAVVIVTHDSAAALSTTLPALATELRSGDELVVHDNGSRDGIVELVRELTPRATVIEAPNVGFGAGCNAGAEATTAELLLFLNPDAVPQPGFREGIERPLRDDRGWDLWQGLVTSEGGERVNTRGGIVHYTGIAWAGGAGDPRAGGERPREVAFASGACLAVTRAAWEALGGFAPGYFLYHEDTELGLRAWLSGYRVGCEPAAVCDHDYEFGKGSAKWRQLERNRLATILRTYPARLLALVAPALLAAELAIHVAAVRGGWLRAKLGADRDLLAGLPPILRQRREVQRTAELDARELADLLTPRLDSAYLGPLVTSKIANQASEAWWRLVRALL